MKITVDMLREAKACEEDTAIFEEHWPDGCDVTLENCITAFCELELGPNWAARRLLGVAAERQFNKDQHCAHLMRMDGLDAYLKYRKALATAFYNAVKLDEEPADD